MEIKEFIEKFAEQFDDTAVSELKPETLFHDLDDYSSIAALSIIGMVDEEYRVAVTAEEMRMAVTISDLYNIVKSKS